MHKLAIKTNASIKWTIRNNSYIDWITILEGDSGKGPGTLTVQLEPNSGRYCRVGELTIEGLDPIYGLPIRILQEGTGAVSEEKPKEPVPTIIQVGPFPTRKPQTSDKPE